MAYRPGSGCKTPDAQQVGHAAYSAARREARTVHETQAQLVLLHRGGVVASRKLLRADGSGVHRSHVVVFLLGGRRGARHRRHA